MAREVRNFIVSQDGDFQGDFRVVLIVLWESGEIEEGIYVWLTPQDARDTRERTSRLTVYGSTGDGALSA